MVSRSVAKDQSHQLFKSEIIGNAKCSGHTECDAIIMDDAKIVAVPGLTANNLDAALIHEAAIGKDRRGADYKAYDPGAYRGGGRSPDREWILKVENILEKRAVKESRRAPVRREWTDA